MSEPTPEDIAAFNAAAQQYADESGKTLDEAKEELGNLLKNMTEDPTGTALYFARRELASTAALQDVVVTVDAHETRIERLERLVGEGNELPPTEPR